MTATVVSHLTKHYGSVRAISDITMEIRPGAVHALLGPNGAGKSTLIKCIAGAIRPSAGSITIDGTEHSELTPRQAMDAGIAVIYQQFSLVSHLSVADNIFLGHELRTAVGTVRRAEQSRRVAEVLARVGADIDPRTPVGSLSVAQQQVIEIAKALARESRLLVLDEPSASLSETERQHLMRLVRALRADGLQILYITHLLDEVMELADDVTVLRDGRVSLSSTAAELDMSDLINAITGGVDDQPPPDAHEPSDAPVALDIRALAGDRLGPVDLTVRAGEVVGVFGLLGSGRTELVETIYGVRARTAGTICVEGRGRRFASPRAALRDGVALVPAERVRQSLFADMNVKDNLLIGSYRDLRGQLGVRSTAREHAGYAATKDLVQLTSARPSLPVMQLSGGNQQKVAIGRWLVTPGRLRVFLLDEPTQGIDVGTRRELYRLVRDMAREQQLAVVMTSSYPEEIVSVSDRAVVLAHGRVVVELTGADLTSATLLAHANGVAAHD